MSSASFSVAREAGISFGINAALSLAFFVGVFGLAARPLGWGAPDALGFDFLPQSIAVALMSALVPALVARKRLAMRVPVRAVVLRALGLAAYGAVLGGLLAWGTQAAGLPAVGSHAALAGKLLYGGSLGALITSVMLNGMLRPLAR